MNPKFRNLIVFLVIGLIFTEFGYQYIHSERKIEAKNPIDKNGKIKEGRKIPIKEQKEMEINSYPTVKESEYAKDMLYAFGQCIMSATSIGDSAYYCLSNNVSDAALEGLSSAKNEINRGQTILDYFTQGKKVTNITAIPKDNEGKDLNYFLTISFNYDAEIIKYELLIKEKKIVTITLMNDKKEEVKDENNS